MGVFKMPKDTDEDKKARAAAMQAAAKKQEFERAATLRDRIRALEVENLKYA